MTDLPPWAVAALAIEGIDAEGDPRSVKKWEKLGPLTQEKGDPYWASLVNLSWSPKDLAPIAGFTCEECPQRERAYSEEFTTYTKDSQYTTVHVSYTQRCPECSRKMKRWQRGQNDAKMAEIASICYEQGTSFVTLTAPNMVGDPVSSVRKFKKWVAEFRKDFPEDVVSGGKDYYEWTTHPDDKAWSNPIVHNVHMHGVWVMDYWKQSEMQDRWSRGIVHLKRASSNVIRYCTKYASKQDVKGIRLKESFGCLYGSAKRAMLDAYQVRLEDR